MKKLTLSCIAILLLVFSLNNSVNRGLMKWLNTPATTIAEISGKDGALTVTAPNTIVNKYSVLAVDAAAGAMVIAVTNPGGANGLDPATLTAGDLILIIQLAGASIDGSDTANYGTVTNLNNAGRYEFVTVNSVNGNMIFINPPCSGLRYSYTASGKVQVIRVPQYTSLTINSGASLTAPAWDGKIGGIVAVHVQNNAIINGAVDVSGSGFRGGALSAAGGGGFRTDFRTTQQDFGAEKGEGIAGYQMDYDFSGGRYGRGAAANAGGGGTAHNSGGGGGANGNNGNAYNGNGIMDPTPAFQPAWALDPGYSANGNALTNSSGGGRGGYSYSVNEANALTVAPGNPAWGGDNRREVGGRGGRTVPQDTSGRIFLGGGGGAGAQNNDAGGGGGNGGGLIYIIANSVSGSGALRSNGTNGGNTRNENRDGAGGAGAGGTIVIAATTLSGITATADGGDGGDQATPTQANFPFEAEGPGGGGGGGYIAYTGGTMTTSVKGGTNGETLSNALPEFRPNGATRGADGTTSNVIPSIPFCSTTTDLSITKTDNKTSMVPGTSTTYTIVVRNNGPNAVFGIPVTDNPPAVFSNVSWTCTATAGSACSAATGAGNINTKVDLLVNGTATFLLTGTVNPSATGTVTNTAKEEMPGGAVDTNPNNDTATDTNQLTPQADLSITKTNGVNTVIAGMNTTYSIVVRNNGPSAVTNAPVSDTIPANLTNATWTCIASNGSSCGAASGSGNINTTVSLPVNGTATFTLTATVLNMATGSITNTATVAPPNGVSDLNPNNNTATDTDTVGGTSDLAITKVANTSPVTPGSQVSYQIEVTNNGPSAVNGAPVTDTLPAVLSNASWTCTATGGSSCGAANGTGNINTTVNLLVGGKATFSLTATLSISASGTLTNTATVAPPAGTTDPNSGNNSSTANTPVTPGSDFKTTDIKVRNSSTDICIGSLTTINVEVKLTNSGTGPQRNNPGPEMVARFPIEVSGIPGSCNSSTGQCTIGSGQVEWNGEIAPGQTVVITYRVRTRFDLQPGTRFCTEYKVNYDTNGDGVNDATMTSDSCLVANCTPPPCNGPDCPNNLPGLPYEEGPNSAASDQRPGSVLIFPFYSSDAVNSLAEDTRISITNTDPYRPAFVHLFFVDGSSCTVADNYLCLTPNQTTTFLTSDLDPGVPGYLIAVAVDAEGCPTNFNSLIGDEYIRLSSGHIASLGATSVPAINPRECDFSSSFTTINFDGVEYSRLGRVLAVDNVLSVADGNSTLLILDSIGGDLTDTASTLGPIFGLLYNDQETSFSFGFNPGACQFRQTLSGTFPRSSPRFPDIVPAGRSGWIKIGLQNEGAMVGVALNTSTNPHGDRGGHNLHILTLGKTSITIPLLAPPCQ
jgi:uncharacterized repeat protein (TIGR01451 family)